MKKKGIAAVLAAVMVCSFCGCGRTEIKMGTAAEGGVYYAFGQTIQTLADENQVDFTVKAKTTAGSDANLRLLSQGYLELAIAQSDSLQESYYGSVDSTSAIGEYQGYSALTGLYTEACQIVVRADSDIQNVEDLAYCEVSVGEVESGTENNAEEILNIYGIEDLVGKENMNYSDAAAALEKGSIDAMFCTAGVSTESIRELAEKTEIRLLSIDEEHQQALQYAYGFYLPFEISAGTYPGLNEDVETVGVKAVLVANDTLSEEMAEEITRLVMENGDALQESLGVQLDIDPENPLDGVTIPVHPGAEKYFKGEED